MGGAPLAIDRRNGVAVLRLNRPQARNALSPDLIQAIIDAFCMLEEDGVTRCVVIIGGGPVFCAGAELSTLRAAADGDFAPVESVYEGFLRVLHSPLLTIAAVNGAAVGAGFNLALACDIRLAAESASFDSRFAELRIHPGGGHWWLLARAVGTQRATLAAVFGQTWDARAALEIGLVVGVCADAALEDTVATMAARLNDLDPEFVRVLTNTMRQTASTLNHDDALALETAAQKWSVTQPPFLDGLARIEARIRKA